MPDYRLKAYLKAQEKLNTENSEKSEKKIPAEVLNPSKPLSDFMEKNGLVKITKPAAENNTDSVYRRVAKFLYIIGIDEAAKIIPHLTPEQIEKVIPEIATLNKIDDAEAVQILDEFKSLVTESRQTSGLEVAREILKKAFGSKKADEVIHKSVAYPEGKPFEYLNDCDSERINLVLKDESVPVITLVVSHLKPVLAATVIKALSDEQKTEVIKRLAKMEKVSPLVVTQVDRTIHEKILSINTEPSESIDGKALLAGILKKMPQKSETEILQSIALTQPELSEDIKSRLFTREDFLSCDDKYLQKKLQNMGDKDLAYIIAGKDEAFRGKILSNVSQGRGSDILQEESYLKPVKKSEVDEKTELFMSDLRRAWEKGDLLVFNRDDGEIFV